MFIDALYLDPPRTGSLRTRADTGSVEVVLVSPDSVRLGMGRAKDQLRIGITADGEIRSATSGPNAKDRFSALATSKRVPPG